MRILNACVLLKEDGRLFTLVLAGQGPDMQSVKDEVKAFGLAENTMFTGHITDEKLLNGLISGHYSFVFPRIYDTCGLVVREAAAMGKPCCCC